MKRFFTLSILVLVLTQLALAGSAPRIIQCGVDPVTVHPGDNFTLYADVSDADGLSDVSLVGLLSGNDLLMLVPESETVAGRFDVTYTMPDTAASGTYTLSMAAVDSTNNVSSITYFTFSIAGEGPAVTLVSPEDGEKVSCNDLTIFEWMPFNSPIAGYVFALDLTEGVRVVAHVPPQVTSLPVPGALWTLLPDGEYFWQVGVVSEPGGEPYAWSELRSFNVDCSNPWPGEILGEVIEKDPDAQQLRVRSHWDHGPHGVMIQVTGDTTIYDSSGAIITFEDIQIHDIVFAIGEFQENLFFAEEIWVEDNQPPPPMDEVMGYVQSVDLNASTVTIQGEHSPQEITVQITDETVIMNEFGPITIEDIEIDDFLNAFGAWEEDLFVASDVFVMSQPGPGPGDHYFGIIDAVHPDTMTFDLLFDDHGAMETITVQVTEDTMLDSFEGPITFEDLEVGQEADVAGLWEEDLFIAHHVFVHGNQPPPPPPMDFVGTITEIDPDAMILMVDPENRGDMVPVQVTPDTMIEGPAGPLAFEDLVVGMFGHFHGEVQGDLFVAFHIFIDDNQPPPQGIDVAGIVDAVDYNAQTFVLIPQHPGNPEPILVQADENTMIFQMGAPAAFDDIQMGMFVFVHGQLTGDVLLAEEIHLHN